MGETPVLKAETGDQVYYTGHSHNPEGGGRDRLVHGTVGKVTGRASGAHAVAVHFEGNHESIDCALDDLSKEPPPALPGGYKLDDELYFLGASQALETGDRLVHGAVGRVTGPAAGGPHAGKGLCMLYRGNDASVNCPLDDLSKDPPPPLLGGEPQRRAHTHTRTRTRPEARTRGCCTWSAPPCDRLSCHLEWGGGEGGARGAASATLLPPLHTTHHTFHLRCASAFTTPPPSPPPPSPPPPSPPPSPPPPSPVLPSPTPPSPPPPLRHPDITFHTPHTHTHTPPTHSHRASHCQCRVGLLSSL